MNFQDLGVAEQRTGLRRGDFSCTDYARWIVGRISATRKINPLLALNEQFIEQACFIGWIGLARNGDAIRADVPLTLKDNRNTRSADHREDACAAGVGIPATTLDSLASAFLVHQR